MARPRLEEEGSPIQSSSSPTSSPSSPRRGLSGTSNWCRSSYMGQTNGGPRRSSSTFMVLATWELARSISASVAGQETRHITRTFTAVGVLSTAISHVLGQKRDHTSLARRSRGHKAGQARGRRSPCTAAVCARVMCKRCLQRGGADASRSGVGWETSENSCSCAVTKNMVCSPMSTALSPIRSRQRAIST